MIDRTARMRASRLVASCTLLLAPLVYACGGSSGDSPTGPGGVRGIHVIAGGEQTDTVTSTLSQALIVEVRDSAARIAKGVTVQFTRVGPTNQAFVWVSPPSQQNFLPVASATTDAQGRASTLVRYGSLPGTARIEVSVPELGLVDTVSYTLNPGAPARLFVSPADTSVAYGSTYQLRIVTTDQFLNPISGITPALSATAVTVSATGRVTTPNAAVRARIIGTYQGLTGTASVWVVPKFPMVINRSKALVLINSDGTGATTLANSTDFGGSVAPSSVAATRDVVFHQTRSICCSRDLWVVQPGGTPRLLLSRNTSSLLWPRLSPDGTWVYFVSDSKSLWRVHLDGTGLDSLTAFTGNLYNGGPGISPDGKSVAVQDGNEIKIFDVTTRTSTTVPVSCTAPSYSPDGAWFACLGTTDISVVRTDGTGKRVVADLMNADPDDVSPVDWSPDGKWLLATTTYQGAVIVEVSSDTVIPLTGVGLGPYEVREAMFVR